MASPLVTAAFVLRGLDVPARHAMAQTRQVLKGTARSTHSPHVSSTGRGNGNQGPTLRQTMARPRKTLTSDESFGSHRTAVRQVVVFGRRLVHPATVT